MAVVQEQFEQSTQQTPQQPKKANWWKRGVLIVVGAGVLMVGGCSTLVGIAAVGSTMDDPGNGSNPGKTVDTEQVSGSSDLEGQNAPKPEKVTKTVKVVVSAPEQPADYSAYDDKFKVNDAQQISGTKTFTYELPKKDGMDVSLMTEGMNKYVAIEVYEDGKLVASDEDTSMGMAMVSY